MSWKLLILLLCCTTGHDLRAGPKPGRYAGPKPGRHYYVSKNGMDSNKGSLKSPFATLDKALETIRHNREKGDHSTVTVVLRRGTYSITASISINKVLSGINILNYPGEMVNFTGGVTLSAKSIAPATLNSQGNDSQGNGTKGIIQIDLRKQGVTNFGNIRNTGFSRPYGPAWGGLFINGQPMHLARWPNDRMIPMGKVLDPGSIPRNDDFAGRGGIIEYDSTRINKWVKEKDAWMAGYFMWGYADDMVRIKGLDTARKTITTASATLYGFGSGKPWQNWYGVNLLTELDEEGEYYVDRDKGMLYFIPAGGRIGVLDFSVLEDPFIVLDGATDVTIRGIVFECARGIGIAMSNTNNVTIRGCTFRNLGSLGITVGKGIEPFTDDRHEGTGIAKAGIVGSLQQHLYANTTFNREGGKNNTIIGCVFYQLGAGGISLGGGDRLTLEKGNNSVENCVFHDINRIERSYRPAVYITGVGNKVRHCEIYDVPAMALLMHGNDHLVEYNYIHDVCTEAEDQGAFYFGRDPSERGTVIRYNYFEHIPDHFRTCAIYEDDGACGLTVTGNIFYKAGKWDVLVGGGSDNSYSDNIFIGNKTGFYIDDRLQSWAKDMLGADGLFKKRLDAVNYQHPPYSVRYPRLSRYNVNSGIPAGNLIEDNVFVRVGKLLEGEMDWLGYRKNNRVIDRSVVYKRIPGFKEIHFSQIGLYESAGLPTIRQRNGSRVDINENKLTGI